MAQLIEVPGQGVVEFPDGMTDAQISDAIRRSMGSRAPAPQAPTGGQIPALPFDAGTTTPAAPAAPTPAAPAEKSLMQSVDDRARWLANFVTLGFADKLAAKADEALGQGTYQQNLANQRLRSASAETDVTTPEKLILGAAGIAPMVLAGGPSGALASAARMAGAPAAVTSTLSSVAAPTTLAGRVGLGVAEGGLLGAAEAAGRDTDMTEGSLIGAGVGAAVPVIGAALSRAVSPITNVLTPEQQRLAQEMRARGFDLTPAQATGSRMLGYTESVMRDLPGGALSPRMAQQEMFNEQVLRASGVAGREITPEVLESGFNDIGGRIGGVVTGKTINFDKTLVGEVDDAIRRYSNTLDVNVRPVFKAQAEAIKKSAGSVGGDFAQNVRSELVTLERNYASQPRLAAALGRLRESVDSAMQRSLPQADAAALKYARGQYKNLKRVEEAYNRGGAQAAAGGISPVALRQTVKRGATPELETLARGGDVFLRELPQSGTAPRQNVYNMLTGAAGGAGLMAGGLPGLAAGLGATVAGPYAANVAYNNPLIRKYLENQLGRRLEQVSPQFTRATTLGALGLLD
jgi:hypothetical protein